MVPPTEPRALRSTQPLKVSTGVKAAGRDDYMFGDLNIVRFILLVLMFVVSIKFLIISHNIISILLG